jgi:hypothetical protein
VLLLKSQAIDRTLSSWGCRACPVAVMLLWRRAIDFGDTTVCSFPQRTDAAY